MIKSYTENPTGSRRKGRPQSWKESVWVTRTKVANLEFRDPSLLQDKQQLPQSRRRKLRKLDPKYGNPIDDWRRGSSGTKQAQPKQSKARDANSERRIKSTRSKRRPQPSIRTPRQESQWWICSVSRFRDLACLFLAIQTPDVRSWDNLASRHKTKRVYLMSLNLADHRLFPISKWIFRNKKAFLLVGLGSILWLFLRRRDFLRQSLSNLSCHHFITSEGKKENHPKVVSKV